MKPSKYQRDIFQFVSAGTTHGIVQALAGSGKTTTIVESSKLIPTWKKACFLAYNKAIAEELSSRLGPNCQSSTIHSLCYGVCRDNLGKLRVNNHRTRGLLKWKIFNNPQPGSWDHSTYMEIGTDLIEMVSILKGHAIVDLNQVESKARELSEYYGIALNGNLRYLVKLYKLCMEFNSEAGCKVLDYDDMLFFPILYDWKFPQFDIVFVDEAQDLNPIQRLIIRKITKEDGRIIAVGDPHQAIYGFRGASPDSMDILQHDLSPRILPLSISYRCSRAVVEEAKLIVPAIESTEDAPLGSVSDLDISQLVPSLALGDRVLSRTTAPLVPIALELLTRAIPAKILGMDIEGNVIRLLKSISSNGGNLDETALLEARNTRFEELEKNNKLYLWKKQEEAYEILRILAHKLGNPKADFIERIVRAMFSDSIAGVTLSTIHKAKGLEADRVFLIRPDLLPHPKAELPWELQQETNLKYVAITRAKKDLFYVHGDTENVKGTGGTEKLDIDKIESTYINVCDV